MLSFFSLISPLSTSISLALSPTCSFILLFASSILSSYFLRLFLSSSILSCISLFSFLYSSIRPMYFSIFSLDSFVSLALTTLIYSIFCFSSCSSMNFFFKSSYFCFEACSCFDFSLSYSLSFLFYSFSAFESFSILSSR